MEKQSEREGMILKPVIIVMAMGSTEGHGNMAM